MIQKMIPNLMNLTEREITKSSSYATLEVKNEKCYEIQDVS